MMWGVYFPALFFIEPRVCWTSAKRKIAKIRLKLADIVTHIILFFIKPRLLQGPKG